MPISQNSDDRGDLLDFSTEDLSVLDDDIPSASTAGSNSTDSNEQVTQTAAAIQTAAGSVVSEDLSVSTYHVSHENPSEPKEDPLEFNIIEGTEGDDVLYGTDGRDAIYGYGGNDTLYAVDGDGNRLYGGKGDDVLYGGDGRDYLSGGDGNDRLYGYGGDDVLNGGKGDDRLFGGDGNDILTGGYGDDYLSGGDGDDKLYGGDGNDVLNGGTGDDHLTGGGDYFMGDGDIHNDNAGNDTFVFDPNFGNDKIHDFWNGDNIIDLTGLGVSSFEELQGYFKQALWDMKIDFGDGNSITLEGFGTQKGRELTADDFKFNVGELQPTAQTESSFDFFSSGQGDFDLFL